MDWSYVLPCAVTAAGFGVYLRDDPNRVRATALAALYGVLWPAMLLGGIIALPAFAWRAWKRRSGSG